MRKTIPVCGAPGCFLEHVMGLWRCCPLSTCLLNLRLLRNLMREHTQFTFCVSSFGICCVLLLQRKADKPDFVSRTPRPQTRRLCWTIACAWQMHAGRRLAGAGRNSPHHWRSPPSMCPWRADVLRPMVLANRGNGGQL